MPLFLPCRIYHGYASCVCVLFNSFEFYTFCGFKRVGMSPPFWWVLPLPPFSHFQYRRLRKCERKKERAGVRSPHTRKKKTKRRWGKREGGRIKITTTINKKKIKKIKKEKCVASFSVLKRFAVFGCAWWWYLFLYLFVLPLVMCMCWCFTAVSLLVLLYFPL